MDSNAELLVGQTFQTDGIIDCPRILAVNCDDWKARKVPAIPQLLFNDCLEVTPKPIGFTLCLR